MKESKKMNYVANLGEFSLGGMKKIKVKATFIDEILGSCPCTKEVYLEYIKDKWEKKKDEYYKNHPEEISQQIKEEADKLPSLEEDLEERKITVFLRNDNKEPVFSQHVIKGFFKNAAKAFYAVNKPLSAYKTKIDNLIFVGPDYIPIKFQGEIDINERPLRAETAQGPRVALAASESIPAGAEIEFEVMMMDPSLEPHIIDWLHYGQLNGLGQWHNGGKGRFTFELIE